MKMHVWAIGKKHETYVQEGVEAFTRRLKHYFPLEWHIIPVPKNAGMLSTADLKASEGRTVLEWLRPDDFLVALDEHGQHWSSEELAGFLKDRAEGTGRRMIFLIGGSFGLDANILRRADRVWSLSFSPDLPASTRPTIAG